MEHKEAEQRLPNQRAQLDSCNTISRTNSSLNTGSNKAGFPRVPLLKDRLQLVDCCARLEMLREHQKAVGKPAGAEAHAFPLPDSSALGGP